jgi:hypothetical protein
VLWWVVGCLVLCWVYSWVGGGLFWLLLVFMGFCGLA